MPHRRPLLTLAVIGALAPLLGACNGLSIPGPTAAAVLPPEGAAKPVADRKAAEAALPEGKGCGPAIARTQALVDSDVSTENLNASVGKRFSADLDKARGACSAGHDAEGLRLLAAAKSRYGYR